MNQSPLFIIYYEAKNFENLWVNYQICRNEMVVDYDFADFQRGGLSPFR